MQPICINDCTATWTDEQLTKAVKRRGYSEKQTLTQNLQVLQKALIDSGQHINKCFASLNQFLSMSGASLQLRPKA